MKRFTTAAMIAFATAPALAGTPAFDAARISHDIQVLSSDDFEGRAPATAGEVKATTYIADQMRKAGLTPAGEAGGWFQNVPLLKADIVGAPQLSLNVAGAAQPLTQGREIAVRAALTGHTAVAIEDAALVFVGYGVKAPERRWDDLKGVDLHGKMDGPFGAAKTKDFSISSAAKLDLLTMLGDEAAKQGRRFTPDARPEAGSFYRSDHLPFAKRGVPAVSYDAGQNMVVGGEARGKEFADAYIRDRYHQPADAFDPNWETSSVAGDMAILSTSGGGWRTGASGRTGRRTASSAGFATRAPQPVSS